MWQTRHLSSAFCYEQRARWPSALVAALFALHPLHVESVAWASERKDTLCTFFGLLSLIAYIRYAEAPSICRYTWVAITLAMGITRQTHAGDMALGNVAAGLLAVAKMAKCED